MTFFFPGCDWWYITTVTVFINKNYVSVILRGHFLPDTAYCVSQLQDVQALTISTIDWLAVNMILPF